MPSLTWAPDLLAEWPCIPCPATRAQPSTILALVGQLLVLAVLEDVLLRVTFIAPIRLPYLIPHSPATPSWATLARATLQRASYSQALLIALREGDEDGDPFELLVHCYISPPHRAHFYLSQHPMYVSMKKCLFQTQTSTTRRSCSRPPTL